MALVWTGVGLRTPPEPTGRQEQVILPYQAPPSVALTGESLVEPEPVAEAVAIDEPRASEPQAVTPVASQPRADVPEVSVDEPEEAARPAAAGPKLINLNTASEAELDLLPGIGPALAGRIIAERERGGRFTSLRDLQRVSGIGPRTAEKLEGLVAFE